MKQGKKNTRIEKGWDKMEFLLDKELPVQDRKKRRFFWLFPVLGLTVLTIGLWIYYPSSDVKISNPALPLHENQKKENTIKPKNADKKELVNINSNPTATANATSPADQIEENLLASESKNIQKENLAPISRIAENNTNKKLKQKKNKTIADQNVNNDSTKERNVSTPTYNKKENLSDIANIDTKKNNEIDKKDQLQVNLNLILKDIPTLRFADQKALDLLPAVTVSQIPYNNRMSNLFNDTDFIKPSRSSGIDFGLRAAYAYNYDMNTWNQEYGLSLMKNKGKLSYGLGAHTGYNHNFTNTQRKSISQPIGQEDVNVTNTSVFEDAVANTSLEVFNTQTYSTGWYLGVGANLSYKVLPSLDWHLSSGINRHLFSNMGSDDDLLTGAGAEQIRNTNPDAFSFTARTRWEPYLRTSISYKFGDLALNLGTQRGLQHIAIVGDLKYFNHNVFAELNYTF